MSPIPRNRTRILSGISSSGSNGRLNLLIILVLIQIVLLVLVLLNQQAKTDDNRAIAEMRQMLIEIDQTAAKLDAISEQQEIYTQNAVIPANEAINTKPDENTRDDEEIVAIKVQVLNGCGVGGIAGKAAKWLQKNGYVIEDVGNADRQDHKLT
ncbi:LytR C-terminal domain-containing protein, partial [bacterium]|nr:LytR C-terminal domain-containing protein [bacterium]